MNGKTRKETIANTTNRATIVMIRKLFLVMKSISDSKMTSQNTTVAPVEKVALRSM